MKICIVHNEYGKFSGEEAVVEAQAMLLERQGHSVCYFIRSSVAIDSMRFGKIRAFFSGIHNPFSKKDFIKFLEKEKPDIAHFHNLFPLISPSVLGACINASVPAVMTVHNYRLFCPSGLCAHQNKMCECCAGGKEYWCVLKNCENSLLKSIGYALRNFSARTLKAYKNSITCYAALTEFQRVKLINEGFSSEKITVIPNMSEFSSKRNDVVGKYVAYVGRISPEKGVSILVRASRNCEQITFKAAGSYESMAALTKSAPANFEFLGQLNRLEVEEFFRKSRVIVLCSTYYEGFPMILVEAMICGKPVIASRIGGIPEIVEDGVTGILFEPGNSKDLAAKIQYLWERPELCRKMGDAGQKKAMCEYSPEKYYERLLSMYEKAVAS